MVTGGAKSAWLPVWPFLAIGVSAVIAGGLLSAVTARNASYHSAWVVAYLVLVVGVAQVALGAGRASVVGAVPRAARVALEVSLFNLGSAGVIAGTFTGLAVLVDAGSVLLVAALVLLVAASRGSQAQRWRTVGFRTLIGFLMLSVVVGIVLAHIAAG